MRPRAGDGRGAESFRAESVAQAWESFALIAFTDFLPGFVTALSDRYSVGGPFPARLASKLQSFPASHLYSAFAGEMPSFREGARYFWAALPLFTNPAQQTATCRLPCVPWFLRLLPIQRQLTKRRMRTFITNPSARNMNNTE